MNTPTTFVLQWLASSNTIASNNVCLDLHNGVFGENCQSFVKYLTSFNVALTWIEYILPQVKSKLFNLKESSIQAFFMWKKFKLSASLMIKIIRKHNVLVVGKATI
jgi:ppGpp synthetase/RelA/SpoT-type nucleotidyltranferase